MDRKHLQRVVKTVVKTVEKIAKPLSSPQTIYHGRVQSKAASFLQDPTHPADCSTLRFSGRSFPCHRAGDENLQVQLQQGQGVLGKTEPPSSSVPSPVLVPKCVEFVAALQCLLHGWLRLMPPLKFLLYNRSGFPPPLQQLVQFMLPGRSRSTQLLQRLFVCRSRPTPTLQSLLYGRPALRQTGGSVRLQPPDLHHHQQRLHLILWRGEPIGLPVPLYLPEVPVCC